MIDWLVKSRQRVKFQGKYNFYLLLNTEHVDSSSTISITSFTDKSQRAAVPCNYIWFIIKNGLPQEVTDFKGSTFICDTLHIGYYIQAHIISNDAEYSGKAIVTFGPVELDVSLKTGILSALSNGALELPIYFLGPEQEQKEGILQLYDSQIKLTHCYSQVNYMFDYSILQPLITPHSREINKATIIFNEKYEVEMRRFQRKLFSHNEMTSSRSSSKMLLAKSGLKASSSSAPKLEIKFLTRSARDTFFFAMKAFIAKKQLKNSAIIRKIENINFEKDEDFNSVLLLDNLKSDLIRYDRLYKQALSEKRKLQQDNSRMQRQLTRAKPNDLSMNVNYSATTRREDPFVISKIDKNESNNTQFHLKLQKLNDQLDQVRNNNASSILEPQMTLSPFSRRKEEDAESLVGLLADLSHFDPERQIEKLEQQKKALEFRLQKSFEKINHLQNKLTKPINVPLPASNGINFTYKANQGNQSSGNDLIKIIDRLRSENQDLHRINQQLQNENKKLAEKFEKEMRNPPKSETKIESHLVKIRSQNRTTDMFIQQQKSLKLSQEINALKMQLATKQAELQKMLNKCMSLERKLQDVEMEIEMYRKNQDVINRSQHMSIQMQNYNEQQIKMLKEHNGFLVEQNEKLVKACERYMSDAKQNNKLRQQIIQLKQKINGLMTNPEANSFL